MLIHLVIGFEEWFTAYQPQSNMIHICPHLNTIN